jgi:iron complex outermembrane receptor protein
MQKKQHQGGGQSCFHRWSRKRYAVFSSLGRQIKIGVLAVGLSLVAMSAEAVSAQNTAKAGSEASDRESESPATVPLGEVLVTGAQTPSAAAPARVVSVISRSEIAQLPAHDLAQLLEYTAGVDLRQRGANGVQADVSIRGGNFDQTLILLNGVNLTDPQTGHHNLNLPIDLASIERIEILQGPGSRSLGPHAFAGVINIITGAAGKSAASADVEGGSYGYQAMRANGTLSKGGLSLFSALSRSESDGYARNTDFGITNLFAHARYDAQTLGSLNLQLGAQQKSFGANGFYSGSDEYESTDSRLASLDYHKDFGQLQTSAAAYYRRHFDDYIWQRTKPELYHNLHRTDVYGGQLSFAFLSSLGKTIVGGELRGEHIYSTNLGDALDVPVQVPHQPDSTFYTKAKQRNIASWHAEHVVYLQQLSLAAGLQGSWSSTFGHFLCYSADAAYSLTSALQLTASASTSLRLPTFTDLNYKSPTIEGNTNLRPEQAATYELGAKYVHAQLHAQASLFFRDGKNIIDWAGIDADGDGTAEGWRSRNLALQTLGANAGATFTPSGAAKKWLRFARLDYAYLHTTSGSSNDNYDLSRSLFYLRHKATLSASHPLPWGFGLAWSLIYEQRNNRDYSPAFLADAKLQWQRNFLTVYIAATNLFDREYYDFLSLREPGRWIKMGVGVRL